MRNNLDYHILPAAARVARKAFWEGETSLASLSLREPEVATIYNALRSRGVSVEEWFGVSDDDIEFWKSAATRKGHRPTGRHTSYKRLMKILHNLGDRFDPTTGAVSYPVKQSKETPVAPVTNLRPLSQPAEYTSIINAMYNKDPEETISAILDIVPLPAIFSRLMDVLSNVEETLTSARTTVNALTEENTALKAEAQTLQSRVTALTLDNNHLQGEVLDQRIASNLSTPSKGWLSRIRER